MVGVEFCENGPDEETWDIKNDYNPALFKNCIKSIKISLEYNQIKNLPNLMLQNEINKVDDTNIDYDIKDHLEFLNIQIILDKL